MASVCLAGLVSAGGYPGVMYQTSNGMMYAAPTSALPNGVIFSLSPQIDSGLSICRSACLVFVFSLN